ncbi:MAG: hypothetical protein IID37_04530 [Planctomycetes bacterium]|nr:hypothetical protein [Planctomycetota bacterium]
MTDPEARKAIVGEFYRAYQTGGLSIIVDARKVANDLDLDDAQARRCFDYLAAKGLVRPMTLGGGYRPTVDLVDEVEAVPESHDGG